MKILTQIQIPGFFTHIVSLKLSPKLTNITSFHNQNYSILFCLFISFNKFKIIIFSTRSIASLVCFKTEKISNQMLVFNLQQRKKYSDFYFTQKTTDIV